MKSEILTSWRGFPQGDDGPLATERKTTILDYTFRSILFIRLTDYNAKLTLELTWN